MVTIPRDKISFFIFFLAVTWQLYRFPCHSLTHSVTDCLFWKTLPKSTLRDLWPLRHVMRRHDPNNSRFSENVQIFRFFLLQIFEKNVFSEIFTDFNGSIWSVKIQLECNKALETENHPDWCKSIFRATLLEVVFKGWTKWLRPRKRASAAS